MAGTTADVVLRVRAVAALVAVLLTTAGLLALVAPFLGPLLSGGPIPSAAAPGTGLDELLVLVCALLLLVGWARLALGTAVCLVAHLLRPADDTRRSDAGPVADRTTPGSSWLRPATARRLAALLVGSSLGGLAAAPAFALPFAAPDSPDRSASSASPAPSASSGPSAPSTVALPLPGRPVGGRVTSARPSPSAAPRIPAPSTLSTSSTRSTPREAAARRVVVRAGDSLWSLAAAHLVPRGRSAPRDAVAGAAAVDTAWRRLYAANRAVIGPDPHLIRPGTRLDLPAPAPTEGLP